MLCRAIYYVQDYYANEDELIKRDERLQISSKTGRVPVKISNKKQWALKSKFNKRLRASCSPRQQKS